MNAWTNVKVTNPDHSRFEQGGTTRQTTPPNTDPVEIHFDNGEVETMSLADLQVL